MTRQVYVRGRAVPVRTHPMADPTHDAVARGLGIPPSELAADLRAVAFPLPDEPAWWLELSDGRLRYSHESWGGCWRVVRWRGEPC